MLTVKLPSLLINPFVPSNGSTSQYGLFGLGSSGSYVSSDTTGISGVIFLKDSVIMLLALLSASVTGEPSDLISVLKCSDSYTSIIARAASFTVCFIGSRILSMNFCVISIFIY